MTKGAGEISIAAPGRLAWIFGSSRSGSTWLLRMLSQLERVVPIDDPHLGHHLGVWRPIPLAWATSAMDETSCRCPVRNETVVQQTSAVRASTD